MGSLAPHRSYLAALKGALAGIVLLWLDAPSALAQDLTQALDMPSATWSTGGNAVWAGQATDTHDGVDAAKGGAIADNQQSWLQATFTGPGALQYWRKISSEDGFDFLRVSINGAEVPSSAITGEVGWQKHTIILNPGANVVRWSYIKDEIVDEGADAAWLDEFSFIPPDQGAPFVAKHPEKCGAELGASVVLETMAFGQAPLQYQWRKNGATLAGETAAVLTLANFSSANVGSYDCVITNGLGVETTQTAAVSVVSYGPALDDVSRKWLAKGDAYWLAQTQTSWDGADALKSPPIGHDEAATFESVFQGPGTLSFRCKTSTEDDFDFLRVKIDDVLAQEFSGVSDWSQHTIAIPNGQHRVTWSYEKNIRFEFLEDAVWVDQIRFSTSFNTWRAQFFSAGELNDPAISGIRADPNHNNIENGWEYVWGNDPWAVPGPAEAFVSAELAYSGGPGLPPVYPALRLVRPGSVPADVTLEIQEATSLLANASWLTLASKTGDGGWTFSNGGIVEETPISGGRVEAVIRDSTPIEVNAPQIFMRARATIAP